MVVATHFKVSIIPVDHSNTSLTADENNRLNDLINQNIIGLSFGEFALNFFDCWSRHGGLVLDCRSNADKTWDANNLQEWSINMNIQLKLILLSELFKYQKVLINVPGIFDAPGAINILQKQNHSLKVTK